MLKICFIVPYFGKFRNDFAFWLKSVEYNNTIDFYIFTDQETNSIPSNVKIFNTTLSFIEELAQKNICKDCKIEHPYKLCDYKTAYGELFKDYIKEYDFWGHCDMDLVFGNIRHFITDEVLNSYDRIGLEGFFTLYRNTPEINKHYWNLGYEFIHNAFTDAGIYGLDEWGPGGNGGGTSNWWLTHKLDRLWFELIFDSLEPYHYHFVTKRALENAEKGVLFHFNKGILMRYGLKGGKLVENESLLVHIQKRDVYIDTCNMNEFSIIPPGKYVSSIMPITKFIIIKLMIKCYIKTLYHRITNRIKKLYK